MNPLTPELIATGAFDNLHGLVEATDFERHALWERYWSRRMDWDSDGIGYGHQIGELYTSLEPDTSEVALPKARPIFLTFMFATIKGKRICFWNASSQLVDHQMVEEWLKTNLRYEVKTDANNFSHVL